MPKQWLKKTMVKQLHRQRRPVQTGEIFYRSQSYALLRSRKLT